MSLYNPSMTIDIKLRFQPTDMTPGPDGRRFQRDLLNLGGKSDNRGYSYADTFLRLDEGAVNGPAGGPGGAAAGAPVIAGTPAQIRDAQAARRTRLKEACTFLVT
jgi:hypothetical protein